MSDDLNTEIKIGADASGVEAGVGRAKRSLASLGDSAKKAGQDAGAGIGSIGAGGEKAARDVERATKNIQGQLQRAVASFEAGEKGSRKFYESIARQRGVDVNTLKPLLDQLDAYKAKSEAAAQASVKASTSFTGLGTAAGLAARAVAAIGITASVGEFVRMADASTNVASRLGLVTSSAAELASVQARLFGIAQSSRVSFVDLVGTYAQVARSTKDLGVSQTALLGVIQTISQAVTISGGSAASAQAALTQLSQGFASGALRGEELNSILEQTPRLAQAIADGLGVGIGQLREMGKAGELTSEKVLGALEKSAAGVAAEFGKMATTVDQSMTVAANSVGKLVGTINELTGATGFIAAGITRISSGVDSLNTQLRTLQGLTGGDFWLAFFKNEKFVRNNLTEAREDLEKFSAQLLRAPNNIYIRADVADARARVAELEADLRRLQGMQVAGAKDPRDQSGFTGRGASYANEAARQAKLRDDANAFRLNQSGVPASYLKDMAELIRLNQAGVLVGDEYTAALKKQQDLLLQKTTTVKGSAAAATAEQNAYESLISSIRAKIEADNLEIAGGAALTESQRIRIKLDQDLAAGRVKLSAQNERAVRLALEELSASEASALAAKTLAKANLDAAASREKYLTSLSAGLDKIQADIAAQIEATERMGLSKEAIAELDAAKLEMLATDLELQAIKAMDRNLDQQTYDALKKQAAAYRELGIAKKGGAAKEAALDMEKANAEAAKKAQEDWERASEQINSTLTDALMRGFESGKDFAKNLRDTVVNMFKTMVLRPVISAVLSPISGALGGAFGGGAAGGGGGLLNMGMQGYSLYNSLTSGTGILGRVGSFLGLGAQAATTTGIGIGTSLANPGLAAAVNPVTAGAGSGLLGGLSAAAPWLAGIAAIAASWKKLFGRELKDSGIEGQFGGDTGFEGRSYKFYEGGVFRSDKTEYSALDETLRKTLGDTFDAMQVQVTSFADALGLNADKIGTFTSDIKLSLRGLSEQDAQAKIQEALGTVNDQLAQEILGSWKEVTRDVIRTAWSNAAEMDSGADLQRQYTETVTDREYTASEYAREGERAIDTLTRLATSLSTVNDIWKNLGNTVYEASLAGADAASKMADAFGGLEAMAAATGAYFENFYSAEEQRAAVERQLNEALGKLNLTLPDIDATDARAQYRALAEAQDRNTEEGRAAYVTLLQLSGAFASVTEAAQAATQSLEQQRQSAYSALQKSVSAERDMLRARLDAAREVADTIGGVFEVLRTNVRELYGEVDSTRAMLAQQGNDFIAQALATARSSGYLPDSEKLAEAIAAARGGLDASNFGGDSAERDYAALVLAGKLSGLEDIAGKQLTDAQRTVKALEAQIAQGDQVLENWKQQIDIASGTYEGILSVEAAVQQLSGILNPSAPGGKTGSSTGGGASGWVDSSSTPRVSYGADEALTSFDKFKGWYQGLRNNVDPGLLMGGGYEVPDWLRVSGMARDGTNEELFKQYTFFKNNSQYASDFEKIMTQGRSGYGTDGSTLAKSDLSKMPTEAAEFFRANLSKLLSYEGAGLDPVLAYQLYKYGPEKFGLNGKEESFTEWLRSNQWTADGIVAGNNASKFAGMDWAGYNLAKYDLATGNLIFDGAMYTPDGKLVSGDDAPNKPYQDNFGKRDKPKDRTGYNPFALLDDEERKKLAAGFPGFAVGTNYVPRDMLARIHEGVAIIPKAYNPAAGGMQSNARLESLIEKLTAEVAELKAAAKSTAASSGQSASVLVAAQRGTSLSLVTEPTF